MDNFIVPVLSVQFGCTISEITGKAGFEGGLLIKTFTVAGDTQPAELVTLQL
jgi:hypothetical protein